MQAQEKTNNLINKRKHWNAISLFFMAHVQLYQGGYNMKALQVSQTSWEEKTIIHFTYSSSI